MSAHTGPRVLLGAASVETGLRVMIICILHRLAKIKK